MKHSKNLVYKKGLNELKHKFRKECIKRLRFSSKIGKIKKDKNICLKLFKLIKLQKPKKVLAYIPLNMEVNILPLINRLKKEKICEVYVPYMVDETFKIVKYRLPLYKKKFGIKEPKNSMLKASVDLAIIPIVGTDSTNRRVGFGKGMYDRYFGNLKKQPIKIFTQRKLCESKQIVTDFYDIKADFIIT
jgi:5-formyltetrahydrofolate cyclo-ligase